MYPQAFKRAGDYGDVVDRNANKAKEYVEKVEAMGDRTKEAASSMTEAAKEKVKEKADSVAARVEESADAARENAKEGVTKAKDETKFIVEKAKDKTEEVAEAVGEKAKQTMQYAWEAAKETTQKIKETGGEGRVRRHERKRDHSSSLGLFTSNYHNNKISSCFVPYCRRRLFIVSIRDVFMSRILHHMDSRIFYYIIFYFKMIFI